MSIGVTDPGGADAHKYILFARGGDGNLLQLQWLARFNQADGFYVFSYLLIVQSEATNVLGGA
jgi:hypothetical protein